MTMVTTHPLVTSVGLPANCVSWLKTLQSTPSRISGNKWSQYHLDTDSRQLRFLILSFIMCNSKINTSAPAALMLCPVNNGIAVSFEILLIENFWLHKYPKQDKVEQRYIWTELTKRCLHTGFLLTGLLTADEGTESKKGFGEHIAA